MIEIRELGPDDAELARVVVDRFKTSGHSLATMQEWLTTDRHLMLVALDGRTPVGWVYGYRLPRVDVAISMWLLYEIDVAESHQRRGLGSALTGAFLEFTEGPVWLVTNRSNAAAMTLYRKMGGTAPQDDDVVFQLRAE